MEISEGMH